MQATCTVDCPAAAMAYLTTGIGVRQIGTAVVSIVDAMQAAIIW